MDKTISRLTVFFEEPFWVGVYERECDGKYEVCRITFGAEPKDYEVYDLVLRNWGRLSFRVAAEAGEPIDRRINPKRMQRTIKRQLEDTGAGTKAQQMIKLQQEQGKIERKTRSREQREAEKDRQFALRQEKRKEKHRGR